MFFNEMNVIFFYHPSHSDDPLATASLLANRYLLLDVNIRENVGPIGNLIETHLKTLPGKKGKLVKDVGVTIGHLKVCNAITQRSVVSDLVVVTYFSIRYYLLQLMYITIIGSRFTLTDIRFTES